MSTTLARPLHVREDHQGEQVFRAEPIAPDAVLRILNRLEPYGSHVPNYGEISTAVAQAANQDPLFPGHHDGCRMTAAILVAMAYCASSFHPSLIGARGAKLGIFQIHPPKTINITGNMLLSVSTACFVAIDLARTSMQTCADKPYEQRLAWLCSETSDPNTMQACKDSMRRMLLAADLYRAEWPASVPLLPEEAS